VGLIASQAGFGSAERMSKVFRQVVGMTPHDYRDGYRHDDAEGPAPAQSSPSPSPSARPAPRG
jgi:AraC-like DNA-binding protein